MTPTDPDPDPSTPDPGTSADGADDAAPHSTASTELQRLRSLLG